MGTKCFVHKTCGTHELTQGGTCPRPLRAPELRAKLSRASLEVEKTNSNLDSSDALFHAAVGSHVHPFGGHTCVSTGGAWANSTKAMDGLTHRPTAESFKKKKNEFLEQVRYPEMKDPFQKT